MITHRCEGNRKAEIPIRYCKRYPWIEDRPEAWVLYHLEYSNESAMFNKPYLMSVTEIKYCPFCGEKLEVCDERD